MGYSLFYARINLNAKLYVVENKLYWAFGIFFKFKIQALMYITGKSSNIRMR